MDRGSCQPGRPRWSIGIGKKDDWEGWTKGVTLIQDSCRCGWKEELEALEDDEEEGDKLDHADLLMKQAMHCITGAFQNLKAWKVLAQMSGDGSCWSQAEEGEGRPLSLDTTAVVSAIPAGAAAAMGTQPRDFRYPNVQRREAAVPWRQKISPPLA